VTGLPPTSEGLRNDATKPYFLWWTEVTVGELKRKLTEGAYAERAYWLGALLREANTRDVWLFTSVAEIKAMWPHVYRHLGKSRDMWQFLLDLPAPDSSQHGA